MSGHEIYRKEILQHLADGYRKRAIAKLIHSSPRTLETWIKKLQDEFNAETVPALVAKALRKNIIH